MKNKIALIVLSCFVARCVVEDRTLINSFLYNDSGVSVIITPYADGIPDMQHVITLNNGDSIQVARMEQRGIMKSWGFDSDYLSGKDSLIVQFADTFEVVHYSGTPPSSFSEKYYLIDHPRNILNGANYDWSYVDKSKHSRIATHRYTFTEADYLDAKE